MRHCDDSSTIHQPNEVCILAVASAMEAYVSTKRVFNVSLTGSTVYVEVPSVEQHEVSPIFSLFLGLTYYKQSIAQYAQRHVGLA